ncbi:hypothetical protein CIPAW_08G006600 [Carya illinoinensis]|uniref:Uncharacterized protein n=1 Tax=Carya illinoinensis TaxID=32201 RepID=A0A8T1PTT6_CARIL|nr:hypothetical protein CIPAW_08G006600 [Carya illinoinensis]
MIFFLAFWDFQLQEPITMIIEGWMDREQIISMSRFCMIHGIEKFHPKESYFFNHDLALTFMSTTAKCLGCKMECSTTNPMFYIKIDRSSKYQVLQSIH